MKNYIKIFQNISLLGFIFTFIVISAYKTNCSDKPSNDNKTKKVRLQLKWKHQFQFAGYYAAIEKGFYKANGIEVELIEADSLKEPVENVFSGGAEFGITNSDIVRYRASGKKPVILATIFQHSPLVILASKASGIEHIHNLEGKRIMVETHAADIKTYMKEEGIDISSCIVYPHSFNVQSLLDSSIDAMTAYTTTEPFLLQKQGFEYNVISPLSGGIDFYGDLLFTREDIISSDRQLVDDFLEASLKGWKYAMKNQDEIINLIYEKYSKRLTLEHLKFEADVIKKYVLDNIVDIGYTNPGRWQQIVSIYKRLGIIDKNFEITGLLYKDYLSGEKETNYGLIILFSAIIFVTYFIVFFYYRLVRKLRKEINNKNEINKKLAESQRLYQLITENMNDVVWILDPYSLKFKYISPSVYNFRGFTAEEIIAGKFEDSFSPESSEYIKRKIVEGIQGYHFDSSQFYKDVVEQPHKDGHLIWTEIIAKYYNNPESNQVEFIGVSRDITRRKLYEDKIKTSNERLAYALIATSAGLWDWNLKTGEVFFSEQYYTMLGYEPYEFEPSFENWRKLVHPDDFGRVEQVINESLKNKSGFSVEMRLKSKSDDWFWIMGRGLVVETDQDANPVRMVGTHIDIGEKKKDELQLLESLERYNQLAVQSRSVNWEVNKEGLYTYVSENVKDVWGYEAHELIGTVYFYDLHPDNEREKYKKLGFEMIKTNNILQNFENPIKHKNGNTIWVNTSGFCLKNEMDEVIGFRGIDSDISDRKQAEFMLEEQKEFLENLIENSGALIYIKNSEGIYQLVNKKWEEATGLKRDFVIGKSDDEIFPAEQAAEFMANDFYVMETNKVLEKEEGLTIDGKELKYFSVKFPLHKSGGETLGICGITTDISELKSAQDELRKSEETLKAIFEAANIALSITDPSGKYVMFNKNWTELLGYDDDEIKNKSNLDITHPEDIQASKINFQKVMDNQISNYRIEKRFIRKDGEIVWGDLSVAPVKNEKGEVIMMVGMVTDISLKKKQEEALKEREEKYRLLTENSSDCIWVLNLDQNKFSYISPAIMNLRGMTVEEAMSEKLEDSMTLESLEFINSKVSSTFPQFISNPNELIYDIAEVQQPHKDGNLVWVEVTTRYRFNAAGEVEIVGASRNIEERKRLERQRAEAEAALKESQEKYKLLSDVTIEGIIIHENGIAIDVNEALCRICGYDKEELIGNNAIELTIHPDDKDIVFSNIKANYNKPYQVRVVKKDKTIIHIELEAYKMTAGEREVRIAAVRDIEEKTKMEAAIRENELQFEKVIENLPISLSIVTIDGILEYANPKGIELFELDYAEEKGNKMAYSVWVNPEERDRWVHQLKAKGYVRNFEMNMQTRLGTKFWAIGSGIMIKYKGQNCILSTHHDITDRKKAEEEIRSYSVELESINEELKASRDEIEINLFQKNLLIDELTETKEELELTNSTKDKFFSIIAHDLKNPLGNFREMAKLLYDEYETFNETERKDFLQMIKDSSHQVYSLLENLLDWSRSQRGLIKYSPEKVNLFYLAKNSLDLLKLSAEAKGIKLINAVPVNTFAYGDTNLLTTVIRNLISNSIKFTKTGGYVEIGIAHRENAPPNTITVYIQDNGIGMNSDIQSKLFRINANVKHYGTAGEAGTGLGLILCKEFIEKHSGEIWAESEIGAGSTFYFTIDANYKGE